MVYVDTRRPSWSPRFAFSNFFGTTLLLGAALTALIFAWTDDLKTMAQFAALLATVIRTMLFAWRRLELNAALRSPGSPVHFNARVIRDLLSWTTPAQTFLFVASTAFGLLSVVATAQTAPWWASLAALTTFSSEVIARYVFFAAGGSKRMPGGVAA